MEKTLLPVVFLLLILTFAGSVSSVVAKGNDNDDEQVIPAHVPLNQTPQSTILNSSNTPASPAAPSQATTTTSTNTTTAPAAKTSTTTPKLKPKTAIPKRINITEVQPPLYFLSKGRESARSLYKTSTLADQTTKDLIMTAISLFGFGLLLLGKADEFLGIPITWIKDHAKI